MAKFPLYMYIVQVKMWWNVIFHLDSVRFDKKIPTESPLLCLSLIYLSLSLFHLNPIQQGFIFPYLGIFYLKLSATPLQNCSDLKRHLPQHLLNVNIH